mgnify:CR=1 FL=1|tara:strand:- start:77 stop:733 length:657 start_codon:yes stop_codon:yes gene_type:complete
MIKKKWIIITAVTTISLISGVLVGPVMSNVEIPNYEVLLTDQNIEIRRYQPMIIAEVEIKGDRKDAINRGFRLLANYIFGNNTVQKSIAMTAPVQQQENKKIAMTAPVQQQSNGDSWKVSFVMPSEYNMDNLPKPNNARVSINEISAKKFAVIKFSGFNTNNNVATHEKQLMSYAESNQLKITGSPKYAFYNPPWTLPFMRRNEVMVNINENQEINFE